MSNPKPITSPQGTLDELLGESPAAAAARAQSAFDRIATPFENRLVLFGAGGFGRHTLAGLRRAGLEPLAFADNNPKLWGGAVEGVRVLSPQDAAAEFGESAVFVVTIWNGESSDRMQSRTSQLKSLGCRRVALAGHLFWKYPDVFVPYYCLDLPHKLLEQREAVQRAMQLWSDDLSRREYVAQIAFRLLLDYDLLNPPGPEEHYFPPRLLRLSPEEVFIDCGAFDGDTIRSLVHLQGAGFSRILAYEPDEMNWKRLRESVAALPEPIASKISCFRQAVADRTGSIAFENTGTVLSTMGAGSVVVDCVTLDEAVMPHAPTFIKFDIEGAEPGALTGGRATIERYSPLLAVSAYHRQSHLWEIPLQIAEMSKDYRFALAPHGTEGWDLVCYAIPPWRAF